jgi:hypothetical protein
MNKNIFNTILNSADYNGRLVNFDRKQLSIINDFNNNSKNTKSKLLNNDILYAIFHNIFETAYFLKYPMLNLENSDIIELYLENPKYLEKILFSIPTEKKCKRFSNIFWN